jgi:hypothetical protein
MKIEKTRNAPHFCVDWRFVRKVRPSCKEAFRVSAIKAQKSAQHKGEHKRRRRRKRVGRKQQQARSIQRRERRMRRRLASRSGDVRSEPVLSASNIHYELSERTTATHAGGIGAMHLLARQSGLIEAINQALQLLKMHQPYHESDHVLNIAYNVLSGGRCLEDLELRRQDEAYLDGLGADRVPDPTTAGDFCRRFCEDDVLKLMHAINAVRKDIWQQQPASFFEEAILEADGVMSPTTGECKAGMDISYKGEWGYHPLVITLANTGEVLFVVNRPGNRPSHEDAAHYLDLAAQLCREAGFKRVRFRGDTDFTQTRHLDGWDEADHRFIFGTDAMPNLVNQAETLTDGDWKPLERRPRYTVKTQPRTKPVHVKEQIVRNRGFKNIKLKSEHIAEFDYRPTACAKAYRMVVVRKNLSIEKGPPEQIRLFDEVRYFFYLTNDRRIPASQVVFEANDRCDQENLIAQLKGGVKALYAPVDNLVSNWAYMVMASLAWTLKAWLALSLPESPRWRQKHQREKRTLLRMEFRTFVNAFMHVPCQVIKTGRRIVYRLLAWNEWQHVFLRGVEALRDRPMRC